MHSFFNKYLAIPIALLCFANISSASTYVSCASGSGDYSDASISSNGTEYGKACHDTNRWQQLGETGNGELKGETSSTDAETTNDGWTAETDEQTVDTGDNGVSWRVQNSDGSWPVDFDSGEFTQGANVEFQFVVTRSNEGNHQFDQLSAWVDWNGDGIFQFKSERIINEKWWKNQDSDGKRTTSGAGSDNSDLESKYAGTNKEGVDRFIKNNTDTERTYTQLIQIPIDAVIGDTWIRARIICENSLHDGNNNKLQAIGYYHQGEVEDYKVAINQVPEPTTILLFGSALIGLVLKRKKA
jgi:hypothetical protein